MISFFPRKKLKGFKGIQKQGIRFTGSSPDGKRMAVRARKGKQIGDQARHGIPFFFYDVEKHSLLLRRSLPAGVAGGENHG